MGDQENTVRHYNNDKDDKNDDNHDYRNTLLNDNGENKSCLSGVYLSYDDVLSYQNMRQDFEPVLGTDRESSALTDQNLITSESAADHQIQQTAIDLSMQSVNLSLERQIPSGEHRHVCATCNQSFAYLSELRRHEIKHASARFTCDLCGKSFTCESKLRLHQTIHTDNRPFSCDICAKTFTKYQSLRRHKIIHAGGGAFACAVCDKRFSVPSSLRQHEIIHTDQRMYVCGVCDRKFTQENNLRSHMVTHTGERKFGCEVCGKKFSHSSSLSRHERLCSIDRLFVARPAGSDDAPPSVEIENVSEPVVESEQFFECATCHRRFGFLSNLRRHERLHLGERPFECQECNKRFTLKAHLMRHERTHTGERPFVCEICQKGFTQPSTLHSHKITHAGVLPFVCDVCNKVFTRRSNLLRHRMSGECSYACPRSNDATEQSHYQKQHSKRNGLPSQTYGCGVCGEMFEDSERAKFCFVTHDCDVR